MSDHHDHALSPVLHWYDFVCPFCYIGQARTAMLEMAGLEVISLPFQAHPEIPACGLLVGPRRGPRYLMLEQQAAAAGLPLHWPVQIPNSRRALAAAEWVRRNQPTAFAGMHYKLFEAHFALGEDIGDQAVIDRYAANAGIDVHELHAALADGSGYAGVDEAEAAGRQRGVEGTPAWLLGESLIAGLRPASEFHRTVRDVLSSRPPLEGAKR